MANFCKVFAETLQFYKKKEHLVTDSHIAQTELKFWHAACSPFRAYQKRQAEHGSSVGRKEQKMDGWIILPPLSDTKETEQKKKSIKNMF